MPRGLSSRARFMVAAALAALPLVGVVAYGAVDRYNADRSRAAMRAITRAELSAALVEQYGSQASPTREQIRHLFGLARSPRGSALVAFDSRGRIVVAAGATSAAPQTGFPVRATRLIRRRGAFDATGQDHIDRVWGVAPIAGTGDAIAYGFPGSAMYGQAQSALTRDLLIALAAAVLALACAFLLAGRATAPIRRLASRVGEPDEGGDIGAIERGVDRLDEEVRRREQELRELNAELERRVMVRTAELEEANRELDAFSYSVSHDLRAPLRAINGFSQILMEQHADALPADGRRYLDLVSHSANDMGQLIDGLLAFSRLGQQQLERRLVDVETLTRALVTDMTAEGAAARAEVSIGELPAAYADPALLRQALVNLLSNAFKYSRDRPTPRIEIGSLCESEVITYFIRDNGTGFDMRHADKLFQVFQRLHRAEEYEGTGLGLALVARIISRHGGRVWAEAKPDQGATFYFTLGAQPA
jgi:signal transduction histidine kinase